MEQTVTAQVALLRAPPLSVKDKKPPAFRRGLFILAIKMPPFFQGGILG
jgi:hypothetical protein